MCLLEAEKMKLQEALRNRNLIVYLCWLMRDDDSLNFRVSLQIMTVVYQKVTNMLYLKKEGRKEEG